MHCASKVMMVAGFMAIAVALVGQEASQQIESPASFDKFLTYYYQEPRPELVSSAIAYMQSAGYPQNDSQGAPVMGFFAEVFSTNSALLPAWKAEIDKTRGETKKTLDLAVQLSQDPDQLTNFNPTKPDPGFNDICWGAYFASGKQRYLEALVARLAYLGERKSLMLFMTAGSAQWSLSSNARQHPRVKLYLEGALSSAPSNLKSAIEETLAKSPSEIQNGMIGIVREQHEKKVW